MQILINGLLPGLMFGSVGVAFALASAMVGIAGALYAAYVSYIDPASFSLNESILMLSMVIVGGTGNVRGPLVL